MAKRQGKTWLRDPQTPDIAFESRRSLVQVADFADKIFTNVARSGGIITLAIMVAVGLFLGLRAQAAFETQGWNFLTETAWTPENGKFGIAAVLFGTVTIALIALFVSVPLGIGTALFISEVLPERIKGIAISMVDLMAAVPSVVFGIWGVFFFSNL